MSYLSGVFGELLRAKREGAKKKLIDLADELEISVSYLSDVERGRRHPLKDEMIETAAAYLGTDANELKAAAAESRGAFRLNIGDSSPKAREVGAALMRRWNELTDEELENIAKVVDRGECT